MIFFDGIFWRQLSSAVFSPKLDSAEVEEQLRHARASLPQPVIWLLGKAQSGKSSIIGAITGSTQLEIGNGFRACTRTAKLYSFPAESDCLVRFLDTRGLGEVGYDPAEDMAFCQEQSHLLMVVLKSMDHAQAEVLGALKAIRRAKPNWPVIVVQTCLHEGYANPGDAHTQPYPFDTEPWPTSVPGELARSLQHQRQEFAGMASRFVVVDLTQPEEGYQPPDYGLESLWNAIEAEFPQGLRSVLESTAPQGLKFGDICFHTAWPHVVSYSLLAGGAALIPVPMFDVPLFVIIQAKMFQTVASIYGQPLTSQLIAELGGALGGGILVRLLGRELLKFIPVVGSAVGSLYAAATTYALGVTLCWYFAQKRMGNVPDAATLRKVYAKEQLEGRRRFEEILKHRNQPPSR